MCAAVSLTEPIQRSVRKASIRSQPTVYFFANHSSSGGVGELWSDLAAGLAAKGFRTRLIALWPSADTSMEPVLVVLVSTVPPMTRPQTPPPC